VVALVEDRGPFEAVGTAWELGTERRSAPMLFAALAVVGATLTTAGAVSLSDRLATLGVNQLLGLTAMGTLVFLTTPLWLVLLLCAPVVHSGRSTPRDLDLAPVDRTLPAGGVSSWRRTALSAALLAPVVGRPCPPRSGPRSSPCRSLRCPPPWPSAPNSSPCPRWWRTPWTGSPCGPRTPSPQGETRRWSRRWPRTARHQPPFGCATPCASP